MENISLKTAIGILSQDKITNAMPIDNLNYMIEDGSASECYKDTDCIYVLEKRANGTFGYVFPTGKTICTESIDWILEKEPNIASLSIDIHGLNTEATENIKSAVSKSNLKYVRTLKDYCFKGNSLPENMKFSIRMLCENDMELFAKMNQEQQSTRPPLEVLFKMFVLQKRGKIIACFDKDEIVGYLSFYSLNDEIYDVDYIYTRAERRGEGAGKALAQAFLKCAIDNGKTAFWSNAKTEASERTAQSAGFAPVRQALIYRI